MKCINSRNFGNYANGWRHPKKGKSKKDKLETTNITEEHKKESSLMEIEEADNENLLHEIDDSYKRKVRFGDGSSIELEGRGKILKMVHLSISQKPHLHLN